LFETTDLYEPIIDEILFFPGFRNRFWPGDNLSVDFGGGGDGGGRDKACLVSTITPCLVSTIPTIGLPFHFIYTTTISSEKIHTGWFFTQNLHQIHTNYTKPMVFLFVHSLFRRVYP